MEAVSVTRNISELKESRNSRKSWLNRPACFFYPPASTSPISDLHRRIAFESGTAATILKPALRQCGITCSGGNRDDFRAAGACFTRSHPGGNQAVGRNQRRALSFDCPVARPSPISDARATGLRRSSGRLPHQVRPYIGPPVVRREDCFQRLPECEVGITCQRRGFCCFVGENRADQVGPTGPGLANSLAYRSGRGTGSAGIGSA